MSRSDHFLDFKFVNDTEKTNQEIEHLKSRQSNSKFQLLKMMNSIQEQKVVKSIESLHTFFFQNIKELFPDSKRDKYLSKISHTTLNLAGCHLQTGSIDEAIYGITESLRIA